MTKNIFLQKNSDGFYPLEFAIKSFCAENLKALMQTSGRTDLQYQNDTLNMKKAMILNKKLAGGNNFLHFLILNLREENKSEVSEMIQMMLMSGCNPNTQNESGETPLHLLLKQRNYTEDLLISLLQHSDVDSFSHIVIEMIHQVGFQIETPTKPAKDVNFMTHILRQWNESQCVLEFENFKNVSQSFQEDIGKLLIEAVTRDQAKAVEILCINNADLNDNKAAFIACSLGHHRTLKVLMQNDKLKFISGVCKENVLLQVMKSKLVSLEDRQMCFDMLINDKRCLACVINGLDDQKQPPLYYACFYGFDEIARSC